MKLEFSIQIFEKNNQKSDFKRIRPVRAELFHGGRMDRHDRANSRLYNILRTVNTQHTSRQDAIITIRLYLATCFGRKRPSSGQLRTISH